MNAFLASAVAIAMQLTNVPPAPLPPVYSLPKVIHDPFDVKPITDTCPVDERNK